MHWHRNTDNQNFSKTGPTNLERVDWANSEHVRVVAACLVQGTYVSRKDFKKSIRGKVDALAPAWWEAFHFKEHHVLRDVSPFGMVLTFDREGALARGHTSLDMAPDLVIAFRGTQNLVDIAMDVVMSTDRIEKQNRLIIATEYVEKVLYEQGMITPTAKLWLAGHSLGASIATCIGMHMVEGKGIFPETFLFNPPYLRLDPETLKHKEIKFVVENMQKVLGKLLKHRMERSKGGSSHRHMHNWAPHLFVNPDDYICKGFIKYFENQESFNGMRSGNLLRVRDGQGNSFDLHRTRWLGDVDTLSIFLLPSGKLVRNQSQNYSSARVHLKNPVKKLLEAHKLKQWLTIDLEVEHEHYVQGQSSNSIELSVD